MCRSRFVLSCLTASLFLLFSGTSIVIATNNNVDTVTDTFTQNHMCPECPDEAFCNGHTEFEQILQEAGGGINILGCITTYVGYYEDGGDDGGDTGGDDGGDTGGDDGGDTGGDDGGDDGGNPLDPPSTPDINDDNPDTMTMDDIQDHGNDQVNDMQEDQNDGDGTHDMNECVLQQVGHDCFVIARLQGCFDPYTKILLADGTEKEIHRITPNDMVWNPVTKKAYKIGKIVAGPESKPLLKVSYGDVSVKVTEDHPMIIENNHRKASMRSSDSSSDEYRVLRADELRIGDMILGADANYHSISSIEKLPVDPKQIVVNFEVAADSNDPRDHMIVADGIVTGDLTLQKVIKKDSSL